MADPRIYGTDLDVVFFKDDYGGDLEVSPQRGLATVSAADNVKQALLIRLHTAVGELPLHPEFGNPALELLSEPIVPSWYDRMRQAVFLALEDEPRSEIIEVEVRAWPTEYRGEVRVGWLLLEEPDAEQNLVWAFNLQGALNSF